MHETDAPDFNKARGFLIGFSLVVFLLWFFGADLTKFKLLGNEIDLHKNVQHVWLMLAIVNSYLWFRFLQRLPEGRVCIDKRMHEILDESLVAWCKVTHHRQAFRKASQELRKEEGANAPKLKRVLASGHLAYKMTLKEDEKQGLGSPDGPWSYGYPLRAKVELHLTKITTRGTIYGGLGYDAQPSKIAYIAIRGYAFIKGAVVHSWFSDNWWPLIFGCVSIAVALHTWCLVNWPV